MKDTKKCESDFRKQGYSHEEAKQMCSQPEGSTRSEKQDFGKTGKKEHDVEEDIE